jgi:hypothetical protein
MKTEEHPEEIQGREAEVKMLTNPNRETCECLCILLGIFSREKLVKENRITYDESKPQKGKKACNISEYASFDILNGY